MYKIYYKKDNDDSSPSLGNHKFYECELPMVYEDNVMTLTWYSAHKCAIDQDT
jgi:hypothetical protein